MGSLDIKQKKISVIPKVVTRKTINRRTDLHRWRLGWSISLTAVFLLFSGVVFIKQEQSHIEWIVRSQADDQKIRALVLGKSQGLPVEISDPKTELIRDYLLERKSPLVAYAGEIARMGNWKLILGIAQAESNLCKKTDKNNCWGIGPGKPFHYDEIRNSLYHADYLITRYRELGMSRPETMVYNYVGYYNPNWITAVNDVFFDLKVKGL